MTMLTFWIGQTWGDHLGNILAGQSVLRKKKWPPTK